MIQCLWIFSLLTIVAVSADQTNSSNSSNVSMCTTDRKDFSSYPQTNLCPCNETEKYNCCSNFGDAVYCPHDISTGVLVFYKVWQFLMIITLFALILYAIYALKEDYEDQKEQHRRKARGTFKMKIQVRTQITILTFIGVTMQWLWSLDPHDGLPPFGVELYPGLIVRNTFLRMPQWILVATVALLMLLWKDMLDSARQLRKKSDKQKDKEDRQRQIVVSSIAAILFIFGFVAQFLKGIVSDFLYDNLTNFVVAFLAVTMGLIGCPYYAYSVVQLLKKMKSENAKRVVAKTGILARNSFMGCSVGLVTFGLYFVFPTIELKMLYYYGVHCMYNYLSYLLITASRPTNSNKSTSMKKGQTQTTVSEMSTAATTKGN